MLRFAGSRAPRAAGSPPAAAAGAAVRRPLAHARPNGRAPAAAQPRTCSRGRGEPANLQPPASCERHPSGSRHRTARLGRARVVASRRVCLRLSVPGLDLTQPMHVEQFPGGHSNLTYLVRFGDIDLVLRRPPLGPVPPTAHDMAREFRWLSAVHPVYPLAPRAYLLCDDPSIVGSVFYVMERRHGVVIRRDEPPSVDGHPDVRRRISGAVIDALADLHDVDLDASGAHASREAGRLRRRGRCAAGASAGSARRPASLPAMDALAAWLVEHLPPEPERPAIVHGDFKLDNLMLDARRSGASRGRVRLGDERARRSAGRSRHPARLLGAIGAARPAGRADDGDEPARMVHP